jgi:plastocyanin
MTFDTDVIRVPAGTPVTINFNNMDNDIPHNFAAYTDTSAATPIYVGEVVTGPAKITYTFTAPVDRGIYFFRCDEHPVQMNGQFIVE